MKPIYVEYLNGIPHAAIDEKGNQYDFDFCKHLNAMIYEDVGSATQPIKACAVTYWAAAGVQVEEDTTYGPVERLKRPARKYPLKRLFWDAICVDYEGKAWCSECSDWYIGDRDRPCEHVAYCWECQMFSTPDERCEHGLDVVPYT
jgi:hypothetical protein